MPPSIALLQTVPAETTPYFARLLALSVADDEVAALEPDAFRRGLHEAFATWISALAAERHLVVAIEDAHWLDASSPDSPNTKPPRNCGRREGRTLQACLLCHKRFTHRWLALGNWLGISAPGTSHTMSSGILAIVGVFLLGLLAGCDRWGGDDLKPEHPFHNDGVRSVHR